MRTAVVAGAVALCLLYDSMYVVRVVVTSCVLKDEKYDSIYDYERLWMWCVERGLYLWSIYGLLFGLWPIYAGSALWSLV